MKILITNDDGYLSPTLNALAKKLSEKHNVFVVAPKEQKSGVSSAITFINPITFSKKEINDNRYECYAVDGTPADCVKLALSTLVKEPDLVISGINQGRNTAINILYSGTVGGAFEGYIAGIPSMAVSIDTHKAEHIDSAVEITIEIINKYLIGRTFSEIPLLNVNIPNLDIKDIKGTKITNVSSTVWKDVYEKRVAPYFWDYYWYAGRFDFEDNELNIDDGAIRNGYISITPLKLDFFNNKMYKELLIVSEEK